MGQSQAWHLLWVPVGRQSRSVRIWAPGAWGSHNKDTGWDWLRLLQLCPVVDLAYLVLEPGCAACSDVGTPRDLAGRLAASCPQGMCPARLLSRLLGGTLQSQWNLDPSMAPVAQGLLCSLNASG